MMNSLRTIILRGMSPSLSVLAPPIISLLLGIALHLLVNAAAPSGDANTYHTIAAGLVGQNVDPYYGLQWSIGGLAVRGFIYPMFIAIVYLICDGPHYGIVAWIQALVLLPLTVFLTYVVGREAFSRRVGIIASWMFAFWFPAVWYTLWLMTETLLHLLMALLLALLAGSLSRKNAKLAFLAGLVLGVMSVSHSAFQFLPLVFVPAVLLHLYFYDRRNLNLAMFLILGIVCLQLPYRVVVVALDLPGLGEGGRGYAGGGGWTFWAGSRAETNFQPVVPDDYLLADLAGPGDLVSVGRKIARGEIHADRHLMKIIRFKLSQPDAYHQTLTDQDYYQAGIQNLLAQPSRWPTKLKVNMSSLFLAPHRLLFYGPDPTNASWFRAPWWFLNMALLMCTALGFILVAWKYQSRLLMFVPFLFQGALILIMVAEARYVIPFWSSMFLLAAVALHECRNMSKSRSIRGSLANRSAADEKL